MLENGGTENTWALELPGFPIVVDACNLCGAIVPRGIVGTGPRRGLQYAVAHERDCRRSPSMVGNRPLLFDTGEPDDAEAGAL